MGHLKEIVSAAGEAPLQFLVIGGLAVNYHGVARDTADLDLLVRREDRDHWREVMRKLGCEIYVERPAFMQFSPSRSGSWPVDLMLVGDPTFRSMLDASVQTTIYDAPVKVVSLDHLLALKLHALKHSQVGRYSKDLLDVENLVRANHLDLATEKTQQLFLKYGTLKLYEQVSRLVSD